jgi:hypothetical protein
MKFRVTLDGRIAASSGSIDDAARAALATAMGELNGLGARNAAIDLDAKTGAISISCAVEADDPVAAVQPASDNIRIALSEGKIGTPAWPAIADPHWTVEFINSRAEALVQ